jgi:cyclohexanone monooxygenase
MEVFLKINKSLDTLIVGAGFAGMYSLHKQLSEGFKAEIFEQGDDVGGTWYWNRYPGARCDIESMDYSFSFSEELQQEWNWKEKYGTQPELFSYAKHVCKKFNLRKNINFNTKITKAKFINDNQSWLVTCDDNSIIKCRYLILATGNLSTPNTPKINGVNTFKGNIFHTGAWPKEMPDFKNRTVGIIGTGSSGVQSIPIIAETAKELIVFQRTPNFSLPARHSKLPADKRENYKKDYRKYRQLAKNSSFGIAKYQPPTQSAFDVSESERDLIYQKAWEEGGQAMLFSFTDLLTDKKANDTAAEFVRNKIREIVNDKSIAEKLCPFDHPIGTKRLCLDSNYFQTYNKKNVSLIDTSQKPIDEINKNGLVTNGTEYTFDDLVFATGFDAMTGAVNAINITNENEVSLKSKWADGPKTYLGVMVSEFPNLFMITGPQSPGVKSQMILSIEQHVDFIHNLIMHKKDNNYSAVYAKRKNQDEWVKHNNDVAHSTLYPLAHSWYNGDNIVGKKRNFMPYVGGVANYKNICDEIIESDYKGFEFS